MSEYFGEQCRSRGLTHSVRDSFYNPDKTREERTLAENHMQKRGKLSFKDEMRVYIRLAMNDPTTQNIHDVVNMLERTYHMNVRLKGNTISYALPYRSSNGGKVKAVRGSKLGKRFTVAGIREYMKQKEKEDWFDYPRQEQDIEHSSQSMKDYPRWEEDEEEVKESASKAKSRYQHRSHSRPENRMFLYMRHMTSFRKNMRYRRMTSLSFMVLHLMTSIKSGRDLMQAQAR